MKTLPLIALMLAAVPVLAPVSAFAAPDPAFLADAMKGDNTEVSIGMLAQKRGATAATRDYGKMLVQDHSAHRTKVAALGKTMGVMPTTALTPDGKKMKMMLMGMRGAKFDAALKQGMIDDHQKDIAMYQDQLNTTQSPEVKQLATDTMPTLNQHLAAAQAL